MKLLEFFQRFPTEDSCKADFKLAREKEGVICKKCSKTDHWWLKSKELYECKGCGFRMSLRSGTALENSKLPFQYWYIAMHLMTGTKKAFSASEMKRQIGHKFYEPVWAMMHKLRRAMANRDEKYLLDGPVELDESFVMAFKPRPADEPLKRGTGSQKRAKVVVMAESVPVENPKKGRKAYKCGRFKMIKIEDMRAETINRQAVNGMKPEAELRTDDSTSHRRLHKVIKKHQAQKLTGQEQCKVLPWVHTAISNAKRMFLGIYHMISDDYLQNYLSEFCYMLNRQYAGKGLFDRLVVAATYHWNQ
jgi:hypothetical protein